MGLSPQLLRGIYAYGFTKPSAIQQRAIVPLTMGRDVLIQAQSGTGKTAAYGIGVLQRVDATERRTQALLLGPTRELMIGVQHVLLALGAHLQGLQIQRCVGGASLHEQLEQFEQGAHVVAGTPGRVLDMIGRRLLPIDTLEVPA
eukprot:SAG11_NODE_2920_length_2836_cov_1.899525_2_plen_145_part_00